MEENKKSCFFCDHGEVCEIRLKAQNILLSPSMSLTAESAKGLFILLATHCKVFKEIPEDV